MAEDPKSPHSSEGKLDFETLNKLHTANYDIFRAKSEEDIYNAVRSVLKLSPYINGYYKVNGNHMNLVAMTEPPRGKNIAKAPKQVSITAEEAAKLFKEVGFTSLDPESDLPEELSTALKNAGAVKAAYIPVVAERNTIGLFFFGALESQPIDVPALQTFISLSDLLPRAISFATTHIHIKERQQEIESLSAVGQSISTTIIELKALYKIIHQQIKEVMGEVNFIVALYDAATKTIQIPYRYENGTIDSLDSFPLGEGLTSILISTHKPLMIVENTEKRAAELGAKVVGKSAKSWMGCPLLVAGESIGAMIVQDLEKEFRFDENDLRFLTSLAVQVGGAIRNAKLFEESRQRALQLQTAAEISRAVSGSLIVDDLLKKSVDLIKERFGLYHASIFLVDPSGEFATIRESSGKIGAQMKVIGHRLSVGSNSIIGRVTSTGETLIVHDTEKSEIHKANPLLPDTRSEAGLPIQMGKRIIGALDVQSEHPYIFTEETVKILQIVADQIAVAFINSELFAEAQERLSQHRLLHHVTTAAASSNTIEEALNSATQGLQVTLGGDQIAILLADRESKTLQVKSAIGYVDEEIFYMKIPFGAGVTGWVAAHKLPLRIDDITKDSRYISRNEKVKSELAIPLIYRNEVLGVLNVESTRLAAYSESDEEMLGTLGGSLAAIIAHSRLLEQFRQQVEFDRMLYEVTSKIRRTSNINLILETTANELARSVGARRARIEIKLEDEGNHGNPQGARK